ncbi:hypothetical protein BTJ39_22135 [Izhakiella australiensis]|uniref:Uncharacterized protein n=1 Tax=Izhakiella australiensis TaxID=1926881 RepID=A0A1S8Y9Z2_9GAMM|nr:hypothetical protein [Izhakiella australiensis]OON35666.1 hypothetical protein BTJ39_22135 [Izhakiella australiensis]
MKEFYTSVIEMRQPIDGIFSSEPYECGWADEALFFLTVHSEQADFTRILVRPKISPDGIHWLDAPGDVVSVQGPGLTAIAQSHFGGWLRLELTLEGAAQTAMITLHLALKG